jgi:F-type H+-transporting ATPase subunit epsilon
MKEKDLQLEIVTPEKVLYNDTIGLVEVPGQRGRFTVLRNHAPIISALIQGSIRVQGKTGTEYIFECKSGYLECNNNKVTILINT